jgi:aspartokinase
VQFNISLVVMHQDGPKTGKILQTAFHQNLTEHTIEAITTVENLAIIAVVGDGMKWCTGIAGKIFSALGDTRINIVAIAQGSSERNISLVISESDVVEAATSIHDAFHMGKHEVAI